MDASGARPSGPERRLGAGASAPHRLSSSWSGASELDFGHEGPVNREMRLKDYDVDDGGSHYVFFMYDAQPAGLA